MGFHGAVGAGVIFGSEIIGSTIQTNSTAPYIELGPNTTVPNGPTPALIMADGSPILFPAYLATSYSLGVSQTTLSSAQGDDDQGSQLVLNGEGTAQSGAATLIAPGGFTFYGKSNVGSQVPGFLYVNPGAVSTDASGNFTIAHPWGAAYTTTVGFILVTQAYYITIANRSSTVITFRAYDHTGTAVANSTVNPYGFLMTQNG